MKTTPLGRLLVVDDNEMNRDLMVRRLRREGYEIDTASEGFQALDMIRSGRFDLILLDVMMPSISGLEMLPLIRKTHTLPDLPIIMATARDESDDIVQALQLGANDYVTKPIDLPVLLARIQTQLRLKSLSQLKDEFIRIASHDLKNPLSTVMMAAHVVRERVPPGSVMMEQHYQMLSFIVKHSEEMQRIIRDFLDFQAMEDGGITLTLAATQVNTIAEETVQNNFDYANSKNISLNLALDSNLPEIIGDNARLRQVAQNLIGNAIKFCRPGASILVRTERYTRSVLFEVVDSGPGLKPEDLQNAFAKYARLSNKPTGDETSTGLGLAICKQMIELHDGQIGMRNNTPNPGATFWFSLPIGGPTPEIAATTTVSSKSAR